MKVAVYYTLKATVKNEVTLLFLYKAYNFYGLFYIISKHVFLVPQRELRDKRQIPKSPFPTGNHGSTVSVAGNCCGRLQY